MNPPNQSSSLALIIPAAGSGERLGAGIPKAFVVHQGKTLLERSILPFLSHPALTSIVVAVPPDRIDFTRELLRRLAPDLYTAAVPGGARRQDSVKIAIESAPDADFVAIHDAARPNVSPESIKRCFQKAVQTGSAILACQATDTVKQAKVDIPKEIATTLDRSTIWLAQTPQIFRKNLYLKALEASHELNITDDASLMEAAGYPVQLVEGERSNIKITWPEDLMSATPDIRIGHGYDIHRLVSGRKLVLGGVHIPFELGLDGHSDADVLLHALMDAMLGALSMGDIGKHFPNTDDTWKGADSRKLLRQVNRMIQDAGFRLGNADVMIIAEKPKLLPHIEVMRRNIAADTETEFSRISIKATTAERLGPIGAMEGIEAHASILLFSRTQ
jgi:2-C-methyl-D-erythritol 4-phosphate cytidylyltransferase/2-C-methyl-D-erythritol 2,4-cyclodiphosphate synthase